MLDTVRTIIALRRSALVRVDVKRVIGTSLHAGSATDAAIIIEVDDAVIAREQRGRWTNRRTRRILTMIAAMDAELPRNVGVHALLDVLHVGAVDADRDVVFRLAGDGAGMAADALPVVYHEAVIHHPITPLLNLLTSSDVLHPSVA